MRRHAPGWIALALLTGCGEGSAPLPSTVQARQALRTALDAWKAGKPPASLAAERPAIEFVDFEWKAGKVLLDHADGPDSPGQGVQSLAATITLKGDPAPKEVTYKVLGLDPVRIFRDQDYDRAMNMDGAPAPPAKSRR